MGQNGSIESSRRGRYEGRTCPYDPPPGNNPDLFLLEQEHKRERTGSFGSSRKKDRYVLHTHKHEKFSMGPASPTIRQQPSSESERWLMVKDSEQLKGLGGSNGNNSIKGVSNTPPTRVDNTNKVGSTKSITSGNSNKEGYELTNLRNSPRQGKRILPERLIPMESNSLKSNKGSKKESTVRGRSNSFSGKDEQKNNEDNGRYSRPQIVRHSSVREVKNGHDSGGRSGSTGSPNGVVVVVEKVVKVLESNNVSKPTEVNHNELHQVNKSSRIPVSVPTQMMRKNQENVSVKTVISKHDKEKEKVAMRRLASYRKKKAQALIGDTGNNNQGVTVNGALPGQHTDNRSSSSSINGDKRSSANSDRSGKENNQRSSHHTPGFHTPGHHTPGYHTPGHNTPGYHTPGHHTPGHHTPVPGEYRYGRPVPTAAPAVPNPWQRTLYRNSNDVILPVAHHLAPSHPVPPAPPLQQVLQREQNQHNVGVTKYAEIRGHASATTTRIIHNGTIVTTITPTSTKPERSHSTTPTPATPTPTPAATPAQSETGGSTTPTTTPNGTSIRIANATTPTDVMVVSDETPEPVHPEVTLSDSPTPFPHGNNAADSPSGSTAGVTGVGPTLFISPIPTSSSTKDMAPPGAAVPRYPSGRQVQAGCGDLYVCVPVDPCTHILRDQNRNKTTKSSTSAAASGTTSAKRAGNQPDVVTQVAPPGAAAEIGRLEALCETRTKQLNIARMQLKTSAQGFDAMTVLVKYLTDELDAFSCPAVTTKLKSVKGQLAEAQQQIDLLAEEKATLEKSLGDLKTQHAAKVTQVKDAHREELQQLQQRLLAEKDTEVEKVVEKYSLEVTTLKSFLEKNITEMKTKHEKTLAENEVQQVKEVKQLKEDHDGHCQDLQKQHEHRMEEITRTFENIKFALSEKVETLREECEEMRSREAHLEARTQREADMKVHMALAQYKHLPAEIESLKAVMEMRNQELHELRHRKLELEKQLEEIPVAREKIISLQQKVENLEAVIQIKADYEKQLAEKHQLLLRKFDKEYKANKRLSMDNEELAWRLANSAESPDLLRRSISHSPTRASAEPTPEIVRRRRSPACSIPTSPRNQTEFDRSPVMLQSPPKTNLKRSGTYDLLNKEPDEKDLKQSDV